MENQELIQGLTQIFQQGLALLQQAQQGGMDMEGGGGDPAMAGADPMAAGADPAAPTDGMGGMDGGGMDGPGMDGMGDNSLHDRVSKLEDHTGLQKSASGEASSLVSRIDRLEEDLLGEQYEGPAYLRVQQLEKAAGIQPQVKPQPSPTPQPPEASNAPDEIQLDTLIKTAVEIGVEQALSKFAPQSNGELPTPNSMRKAAAGTSTYGHRKGQQTTVQTDAQLQKAAGAWGFGDDDLDAPVTLGDVLQIQYNLAKAGSELPLLAGDDD